MDVQGLRVLHVVPGYAPAQGGIETLVDGLGPQLQKDYGIRSSILAPRRWFERPDEFESHGMAVESVDIPNDHSGEPSVAPIVRMFAGIRRAFERQRPDLVHSHGIGHLLVATTRIAAASGVPVVHHIHGNVHLEILETQARVIRDSGCVLAVSEATAESIRTVAGRMGPIEVIPNGIPGPSIVREEREPGCVTMVGRLEPNKGFEHGIQAVARLGEHMPDVHLAIVGVGEGLLELQRLAAGLRVADRVHFLGRCSREETRAAMARSAVVLIPSLTIEGFSLVAAEAAFLGVPVVAYRTGGLASTVKDGVSGVLVDTGDVAELTTALDRLLGDPMLASRIARDAPLHARAAFDVEVFARRIASVYAARAGARVKAHA